jgi:hypothetical protein
VSIPIESFTFVAWFAFTITTNARIGIISVVQEEQDIEIR